MRAEYDKLFGQGRAPVFVCKTCETASAITSMNNLTCCTKK